MKTSTKLIIFLALIAVYLLLIDVTGAQFRLFSSRFHGPGIDVYVIGDYIACFCNGPFIGPMDPYPYRATCAFIGGLLMAANLFWKFVAVP